MTENSHGFIGSHLSPFTQLLPNKLSTSNVESLAKLAIEMKSKPDDVKDGPDPEENLWVPAGYTYFGQFVDHDLTFDSTSSLNPADRPPQGNHVPSNLRTPRFDLDCVYGDGPEAQPFMYESDGATLIVQANDLARASNDRAIIGDKRNDENSIVCQIQLGFIRYHNQIVQMIRSGKLKNVSDPNNVFNSARNIVRWTYQRILVEDFLPRIVRSEVLDELAKGTPSSRSACYALYKQGIRDNLPREFVGAAYRFGHSGVRTGYRLNNVKKLRIFRGTGKDEPINEESLLGFESLPENHIVDDWERFFPASPPGSNIHETGRVAAESGDFPAVRLQFAYKLDTTIVDPLGALPVNVPEATASAEAEKAISPLKLPDEPRPSLALLNLLRGNAYALPTGQSFVDALQEAKKPVIPLKESQLVVRVATDTPPQGGKPDGVQAFQWVPLPVDLVKATPLWFYILAEAQAHIVDKIPGDENRIFLETPLLNGDGALTQLGWVGGRIVAEVFYGLLDDDPESVFNHPAAKGFQPPIAQGSNNLICMRNLLDFKIGA